MIGTLRDSLGLLATRRFGTFWFASLLSSIGTWAQMVAEPWLLLTLGASPFLIGLDSFAMNAPLWLVVLLLAGTIHAWEIIALSLVVGVTDALSIQLVLARMWLREPLPASPPG